MVFYRRNRLQGGTYFFTLTLQDRHSNALIAHISDLRYAFNSIKRKRAFRIDAIVVLPEHLHVVMTLPEGENDYSGLWRAIKSVFVKRLSAKGVAIKRNAKGEAILWQQRFWEHTIRDERDLVGHINYVHINPLKHGLVERVADWPYSSFHRYVRLGLLESNWAGDDGDEASQFGE